MKNQCHHQFRIPSKPPPLPSAIDSASKSLSETETETPSTEIPVIECTAMKIEEMSEGDSLQENHAPIIATLVPEMNDTGTILDTTSIKSELSSKYSGLKKSVRTELTYLKAFTSSEQPDPCLSSVFKLILLLSDCQSVI